MEEDGRITLACFERVTGPPSVINELLSFEETFDAEWMPATSCNGLLLWVKVRRINVWGDDLEEKGYDSSFQILLQSRFSWPHSFHVGLWLIVQ